MAVCGPVQSSCVLVDTYTASVYPINSDAVLLTSSHDRGESDPLSEYTPSEDLSIFLRPVTPSDSYVVKVKVLPDGPAVVRVVEGVCCVNGVRCEPSDTRQELGNGSFLELGSSYRLQYKATPTNKPHPLRLLPLTPSSQTPSSLESSTELSLSPSQTDWVGVSTEGGGAFDWSVSGRPHSLASSSFSGSVECGGMEEGLRTRLKRIAKEITNRSHAHKDKMPPPPYEQVANSINYQLLHHTHPRVTTRLIDFLYSALKEMELKDSGLLKAYSTFLSSYASARSQSATPTCMMPADLPVVKFLTEMMMHICCMPGMTPLARKICPIWMDILSILSTSQPNRQALIEMGGAAQILSVMHLSIMEKEAGLQERGWVILSSIVDSPTPPGRKPVILDATLSLLLSLVAKQLPKNHSNLPLVAPLLQTLARLATVAKEAAASEVNSLPDSVFPTYTPLQGTRVLSLLMEHDILGHMMRVPPTLRTHPQYHDNYCVLVKALHPVRVRKVACREATPPAPLPIKPPPKPARTRKLRRSTIHVAPMAEDHGSKDDDATPTGGHVTSDGSGSSKLMYSRSLHGRPHSHSLSVLSEAGSTDVVFHLLLPMDEECPSAGHVTSTETKKTLPVISEHDHVTKEEGHVTTVLKEDHVTSSPEKEGDHVTNKESHVTSIPEEDGYVTSVPEESDHDVTTIPEEEGDHVTIVPEEDGDHVTSTPLETQHDQLLTDSFAPVGHVTQSRDSVTTPDCHVTTPDCHVTTSDCHVTISTVQSECGDMTSDSGISMATSFDQSECSLHRSDTLARDVQSLLDSLRAPLPSVGVEGRGRCSSHYFRHSVKRRSRKEVVKEVGVAKPTILTEEREEKDEAGGQSSGRMQWGEAPPLSFPGADTVSLFEVSGEVLSPSHTLLEEVVSGHSDVITTLGERVELLEGVLSLWREEKGLQAVTNTIQGCFSEESSDIPLFMDALNCFLRHKGPWTLAVCCVLLPALGEVLSSQRDRSCVLTVVEVLRSVVERFSELILACKGHSRSRRLSQTVDRQQQMLCYQQLHNIRVVIDNRLNMNLDPEDVSSKLRKIHAALKPYRDQLSDV